MIGICDDLRKAVLQAAIQGKLTEQLASDGDAETLYAEIQAEKKRLVKEGKLKKEKPLPPIKEEEIPFDIPDNWKWVRLISVLEKLTDGSHNPPPKVKSGYRVISAKNIKHGKIEFYDDDRFADLDGFLKENGRTRISSGDVILGIIGGSIGNTAIYDHSDSVIAQRSIAIFNSLMSNRYLKALLDSKHIQSQFIEKKGGSAQDGVYLNTLSNLIVPLPPLAEQNRIVAKIDELMAKIDEMENTEKSLTDLYNTFPSDMKSSLLQAAIQGKLTEQLASDGNAETLYAEIQAKKKRLVKERKIKKGKTLAPIDPRKVPFDIPDNWKWVRLGDVVSIKIGKTPARNNQIYWGNDFPWVSISDLIDGETIYKTKEKVSKTAINELFRNSIVPAGTLLMSFKLTLGKTSILGFDAVHNEAIVSLFPIMECDKAIQSYLLKILPKVVFWGDIKNAMKGKTLNLDSISNLLIPLPPLAEQKRIVEKLDQLLPLCDSMKETIDANT